MRPALLILPVLALTACATPREQCIADVTRDTRVLSSLVNETNANLARGYALEEQREVRTVRNRCTGKNEDGTEFRFWCNESKTITTNRPVAIDLNAEQAKLTSLQERLAVTRANSDQAVLQCIAANPS